MPLIWSTHLHITQLRPRMIKSELPACLFIPTFLRSCHHDPRHSMRYEAETKNTKKHRRIPSCPAHCCARRIVLCYCASRHAVLFSFYQSSSLGTWVSISRPLSWNSSSPTLPVCPRINVNIALWFFLSVTKPYLSPHLAGGRTRDLPFCGSSHQKVTYPIYFQSSNQIGQTVIILSLFSHQCIFTQSFLCCHCCFSDTFDH